MVKYNARVFKGHHIVKDTYHNGEPYKMRVFIMIVPESEAMAITKKIIVQSETQPDEWHTFLREYRGKKYWQHMSAIRVEKFLEVIEYVNDKIFEIFNNIELKIKEV